MSKRNIELIFFLKHNTKKVKNKIKRSSKIGGIAEFLSSLHFIILFSRRELVLRRDSFQATPCFWPVTLADCISLITSLC